MEKMTKMQKQVLATLLFVALIITAVIKFFQNVGLLPLIIVIVVCVVAVLLYRADISGEHDIIVYNKIHACKEHKNTYHYIYVWAVVRPDGPVFCGKPARGHCELLECVSPAETGQVAD